IETIETRLNALGFTCNIKQTEYPGHAKDIVRDAPSSDEGMLVIMGGDGTFNECVNGIMEAGLKPRIGYIPTGTSCDIARTLGIPKKLDKALDIIEKNLDVKMDIVKSTHGYFTYVCGIGNYVDVSHTTPRKLKKLIGFFAYLLTGIKEFFTIRIMPMSIVIDGRPLKRRYYSLVLILNTKRVAGFRIVNWPKLDDGKVDLILYRYIPFVNNVLYLLSFIFHVRRFPGIETYKASTIEFHTPTPNRWNIDGEKAGRGRQTVEVMPKALNIIINPEQQSLFTNQGVSNNE
ncbi:MAG: diacylglycerol/lipid kinase family protein, partial [Bacillota bacterium]